MKFSLAMVLATTTLVLSSQALAQDKPLHEHASMVNEYLTRMHDYGLFDGNILVAKGDQILLEKGWGLSDREEGSQWSTSTISTVGSITKQFTGAAMTLLAQQGKIDFDHTLADYFPDVPQDKAGITIHQLLTHSAGFPAALGSDFQYINRDDYLQLAWKTPLLFHPGDKFEYSNTGFSIAAAIIEKVSGTSYDNFLHENIFQPAGMTDTGFPAEFAHNDRVAVGYRGDERWGTVQENLDSNKTTWHLMGNGGIHSTPRDMHKWWLAIRNNTILNPTYTDIYLAPYQDEGSGDSFYAYGWANFESPNGERMLSHNGGNTIFFADCAFYPDLDLFIYTATNDSPTLGVATQSLFDSFAGGSLSLPPDPANIDVPELEQLTLERANAYIDAFNTGADEYVQYSFDHRTDRGLNQELNQGRREQYSSLREQFGKLEIVNEDLLTPFQCKLEVILSATGDAMTIRFTLDGESPYLVALIELFPDGPGSEGEPSRQDYLDEARQLADDGNLEEALDLASQIVQHEPDWADAWFFLGYFNLIADNNAQAIQPFTKALSLGFDPAPTNYNIACAYAKHGLVDKALDALESAVDAGWTNANSLRTDSDLESIRSHNRFEQILAKAEQSGD